MIIVEYDRKWPESFLLLKNELQRAISMHHEIQHVGSTSIPGMYAKPIIDIDIAIENKTDFPEIKMELAHIGYTHEGDQGIPGREVFKRESGKDNEYLDAIMHHLYVCTKDNEEYQRHILFRDYVIKHDEIRDAYNLIKLNILKTCGEDNRAQYVLIKENEYRWFFEDVIAKALREKEIQRLQ